MLLITKLSKILLITSLLFTVSFSDTNEMLELKKEQHNRLEKALDDIEKSSKVYESKIEECKINRVIINDFDFSKITDDNNRLIDAIEFYDNINRSQCALEKRNDFIAKVFTFNAMRKSYKIEDIQFKGLSDAEFSAQAYFEFMNTFENSVLKQLEDRTRKYLDQKLGKLFDGRKLREAYEAYLKKQEKK